MRTEAPARAPSRRGPSHRLAMTRNVTTVPATQLLPEYAEWLERVEMTRESITYCCLHRLQGNRPAAERIGVEVVGGLLARPRVFQYFGLPFSGRVAHLAEQGIAGALRDSAARTCTWASLRDELVSLSPAEQRVFVLHCVEGRDDAELAAALHIDEASAAQRRDAVLQRLQRCAELTLPPSSRRRERGER